MECSFQLRSKPSEYYTNEPLLQRIVICSNALKTYARRWFCVLE